MGILLGFVLLVGFVIALAQKDWQARVQREKAQKEAGNFNPKPIHQAHPDLKDGVATAKALKKAGCL